MRGSYKLQIVTFKFNFRDMMAFASESIHASLETTIIEGGMDKLEMKLGLLQVNFLKCHTNSNQNYFQFTKKLKFQMLLLLDMC